MATEATAESEAEAEEGSAGRPTGPRGLPVVGNLHRYLRDPLAFIEGCADEYGDRVYTNVMGETYMITHPEDVERVLVTEDHQFRRMLADRDRPEYAYFPFGGGPRHCIGHRFATVEARIALATIAARWKLEPVTTDLSLRPAITLRPSGPVEMVVRER